MSVRVVDLDVYGFRRHAITQLTQLREQRTKDRPAEIERLTAELEALHLAFNAPPPDAVHRAFNGLQPPELEDLPALVTRAEFVRTCQATYHAAVADARRFLEQRVAITERLQALETEDANLEAEIRHETRYQESQDAWTRSRAAEAVVGLRELKVAEREAAQQRLDAERRSMVTQLERLGFKPTREGTQP